MRLIGCLHRERRSECRRTRRTSIRSSVAVNRSRLERLARKKPLLSAAFLLLRPWHPLQRRAGARFMDDSSVPATAHSDDEKSCRRVRRTCSACVFCGRLVHRSSRAPRFLGPMPPCSLTKWLGDWPRRANRLFDCPSLFRPDLVARSQHAVWR